MADHACHSTTREDLIARLRRIEGQVRGLQHMVERGEPCTDVLTQVAAARAALAAVAIGVLDLRLHAEASPPDPDDILVAVERLVRL